MIEYDVIYRFRFIDKTKSYIHYNFSDLLIVKTSQGQASVTI